MAAMVTIRASILGTAPTMAPFFLLLPEPVPLEFPELPFPLAADVEL